MTEHEADVLKLLVSGRDRREIAATLALSPHTINHTVDRLRRRNYVKTVAQLIVKVLLERAEAAEQRTELAELRLRVCDAELAMLKQHRADLHPDR